VAEAPKDPTTVKIRRFANAELNLLVSDLATSGLRTSQQDIVGALVLVARAYPLDSVKAAIALYVIREEREDHPDANGTHD
jgi:hypothetical protein